MAGVSQRGQHLTSSASVVVAALTKVATWATTEADDVS